MMVTDQLYDRNLNAMLSFFDPKPVAYSKGIETKDQNVGGGILKMNTTNGRYSDVAKGTLDGVKNMPLKRNTISNTNGGDSLAMKPRKSGFGLK